MSTLLACEIMSAGTQSTICHLQEKKNLFLILFIYFFSISLSHGYQADPLTVKMELILYIAYFQADYISHPMRARDTNGRTSNAGGGKQTNNKKTPPQVKHAFAVVWPSEKVKNFF